MNVRAPSAILPPEDREKQPTWELRTLKMEGRRGRALEEKRNEGSATQKEGT